MLRTSGKYSLQQAEQRGRYERSGEIYEYMGEGEASPSSFWFICAPAEKFYGFFKGLAKERIGGKTDLGANFVL